MAYLFYKVLDFLSNASECAAMKKVVDLIISVTAMIRPHQKICVSGQPTWCNFSQTGNFCGPIILCVMTPIHPSRSGMYTLCMTVQNSTLEPQLLLCHYCYHDLWRLNLSSQLQPSACRLAPRAGVALSRHVRTKFNMCGHFVWAKHEPYRQPCITLFNFGLGYNTDLDISLAHPWSKVALQKATRDEGSAATKREDGKATKYGAEQLPGGGRPNYIYLVYEHFRHRGGKKGERKRKTS